MKEIKLFIDTNVFLRMLARDTVKFYKEVKVFFDTVSSSNCEVTTSLVVLLEIGWTLNSFYGYKKDEVVIALNSVRNTEGIKLKDIKVDFSYGLDIFEKYKVKLGDAMIAASDVVQKEKAIIVSYDKDFDKISGIKRMEPTEATKLIMKSK